MNHIFTHTLTGWSLSKVGPISAALPTACTALAQSLGQTTPGDRFEVQDSVFRSRPFAWDLSEPRHAEHRPAFNSIVAEIGSLIAAKAAADEAVRITAENAPPTSLPSQVYTP